MFDIVTDQVGQGKAVMACHEINARIRAAAVTLVEVTRTTKAVGELSDLALVSSPETLYCVSVLSVPFGPQIGEVADLVTSLPEIPRLGDQFDLRNDWILLDDLEETGQLVDIVEFPR